LAEDGERHWFSALDREDALRQYRENYGEEDASPSASCECVHPATVMEIVMDDGHSKEKRTAREWTKDGPGMVASSVY